MTKSYFIFLIAFLTQSVQLIGQDTLETSGDRQYYDSAHYSVVLGDYVTGERFLKCYMNRKTNLDSWTTYYKNGQLKEHGKMTNSNHIYVGKWEYYKDTGQLDSIVDYDKRYPISFFKAIEIAKTKDFPTMDVTETIYKDIAYWQFARWRQNKEGHGRTANILLISKQTGATLIPDDLILIRSH